MKKLIVLFILLIPSIIGYSQISWNAKTGINTSKINNSDNINMKLGYQVGIGMEYFFCNHWGVQPSLMLISKGYKRSYSMMLENKMVNYDISENRMYLELPVMMAYRLDLSQRFKLVLNGGGYIGYGIAGKYKNKIKNTTTAKIEENTFSSGTEKFDVGLGAGTTLEYLNKYTIGLFGEWGLKDSSGNTRNQTYGINIGYKF